MVNLCCHTLLQLARTLLLQLRSLSDHLRITAASASILCPQAVTMTVPIACSALLLHCAALLPAAAQPD
jgi:hypothetical protein